MSAAKIFVAGNTAVAATVAVHKNLNYATSSRHEDKVCAECSSCTCLDLYLPGGVASPTAALLFMHGGLWHSGQRQEIAEVCQHIASGSSTPLACATVDYRYSQDLDGCCDNKSCPETYTKQAAQVIAARRYLAASWADAVDSSRIMLGGHSAGGHLSTVLAFKWPEFAAEEAPPLAVISVEGIHDLPVWMSYDASHWHGAFHCVTEQAIGMSESDAEQASPTLWAKERSASPVCPLFFIHSPGDDWIQEAQASDIFAVLSKDGRHRLDVTGECVGGQHEDVLAGQSASSLAECIQDFFVDVARIGPSEPMERLILSLV